MSLTKFPTSAPFLYSSSSTSSRFSSALLKLGLRRYKLLLTSWIIIVFVLIALTCWHLPGGFEINFYQKWGDMMGDVINESSKIPEYCYDPYRLPGYVERSELPEGPISSVTYIAKNPGAKARLARPNYGEPGSFVVPTISSKLLADPDAEDLQFLRNRSVLFIGDSLDRNEAYHLAQETFGTQYHRFLTPEDAPDVMAPAQEAHRIGLGVHPKLRFTVASWFLMGVDVEKPTQFFHPGEDLPQSFEGRFEKFYEPLMLKGIIKQPDMVVFNSGLWDLVYLSNLKDFEINKNLSKGIQTKLQVTGHELLTNSEIQLHSVRFTKFLHKLVFKTFPQSPEAGNNSNTHLVKTRFVYRTMPDSSLTSAKSNAMSRKRVRQMDKLNLKLINEFNQMRNRKTNPKEKVLIDILDWRWISNQLRDELIDLVHFSRGATQWLYGDMVLYHLRRHLIEEEMKLAMPKRRKKLLTSLIWEDCSRFSSSISYLNVSGLYRVHQSRSLFNRQ